MPRLWRRRAGVSRPVIPGAAGARDSGLGTRVTRRNIRLLGLIGIPVLALAVVAWYLLPALGIGVSQEARFERWRHTGDVAALAAEVRNPDTAAARAAVRELGSCGPRAVPLIEEAMKDTRAEVREAAALAYARAAGTGKVHPLAAVARGDPSAEVRAAAVTALGEVRAIDDMETLLTALEDPQRIVRLRASAAIARIIGRRYEFDADGTPDQRRAAVAAMREAWSSMEPTTRDYYKIQAGRSGGDGSGKSSR